MRKCDPTQECCLACLAFWCVVLFVVIAIGGMVFNLVGYRMGWVQ